MKKIFLILPVVLLLTSCLKPLKIPNGANTRGMSLSELRALERKSIELEKKYKTNKYYQKIFVKTAKPLMPTGSQIFHEMLNNTSIGPTHQFADPELNKILEIYLAGARSDAENIKDMLHMLPVAKNLSYKYAGALKNSQLMINGLMQALSKKDFNVGGLTTLWGAEYTLEVDIDDFFKEALQKENNFDQFLKDIKLSDQSTFTQQIRDRGYWIYTYDITFTLYRKGNVEFKKRFKESHKVGLEGNFDNRLLKPHNLFMHLSERFVEELAQKGKTR